MIDLLRIREDIDRIDDEIVRLFEERMALAEAVAEFKIETGKPVFDKTREDEKLSKLTDEGSTAFNKRGVQELFSQIMSISRKRQYQLLTEKGIKGESEFTKIDELKIKDSRVVFQGMAGAYTFAAVNSFFGEDIASYHVETWKEAMEDIKHDRADYAVLPIENSTAGAVTDIYDLLMEYRHSIVGEQIIKIEHALLAIAGATITDIKTIYSHPQGLMQCREYLESHREWQSVELLNTAFAAKKVKEDGDVTQAAIASVHAAEHFGLNILEKGFHGETNETRFIIISKQKVYTQNAKKTTICFELPHESGTLYNILSHFIYNGLSMNKIESRPIKGKNWEYRFFIDFEGTLDDSAVKNALRGIAQEATQLVVLGNY